MRLPEQSPRAPSRSRCAEVSGAVEPRGAFPRLPRHRKYITLYLGGHHVLADAGRRRLATSFALVDRTQQRVPLVHPRAEPEEPAAESSQRVEDERDRRVVLAADLRDVC